MEVLQSGAEVGGPIGDPKPLELLKVSSDQNGGGVGGGVGGAASKTGGGQGYGCEHFLSLSHSQYFLYNSL